MWYALIIYACPIDLSACVKETFEIRGGHSEAMFAVVEFRETHPAYYWIKMETKR